MSERPILFSGPMIRAILDGRKTMTRRVVKFPRSWPPDITHDDLEQSGFWWSESGWQYGDELLPNQFEVGDALWVRETWSICAWGGSSDYVGIEYHADNATAVFPNSQLAARKAWQKHGMKKRPSIFMPRWASRIHLEATAVRFERLQEIENTDAISEGMTIDWRSAPHDPISQFSALWDGLNKDRGYGWDTSPWVWVISFERLKP